MLRTPLLFVTVFLIATCGLGYELIAGTVASYLLGDTVTQFSTAIGLYLSALGVGAYLSKFLEKDIAKRFIEIELTVALLGGSAAAILMMAFSSSLWFRPTLYATILGTGTLVGLEVPLLLRILKERMEFKDLVAQVLTVDYIGSLAASMLFPLVLVPRLGLMRTSIAFGLVNALVALWSTFLLAEELRTRTWLRVRCGAVVGFLVLGFLFADRITALTEEGMYGDEVVLARSSPYQRIVVTRGKGGFQLFLNGNLQFSSADEYRYHEALVHPGVLASFKNRGKAPEKVLILGGGDGLAMREVLRYPQVKKATLVDLDPVITSLAKDHPLFREQNAGSFLSSRVQVVNDDAMRWLDQKRAGETFDLIIADFPDPSSFAVGKLYTTRFYNLAKRALSEQGVLVVQSTSPLFARRSYWCIAQTLRASGFAVAPYHAFVPSFGEWGFLLAHRAAKPAQADQEATIPEAADGVHLPAGLRYLNGTTLASLFVLSPDMGAVSAQVNKLNNQVLVGYYEQEWRRWN